MQCERPKTLADGLRGRMGDLTWPIVRDFVDDVITVSEQQIIDAMQLCFERMKVYLAVHLTSTPSLQLCLECLLFPPSLPRILLHLLCQRGHCTITETQQPHSSANLGNAGSCDNLSSNPDVQLVVEPSGAVGLAAALTDTFGSQPRYQGKRIGIVLCGGNMDLASLGLWKQLRSAVEQL